MRGHGGVGVVTLLLAAGLATAAPATLAASTTRGSAPAAAATLATPASAPAAPVSAPAAPVSAVYPVPGNGVADCLRAAGPGRLSLLGRDAAGTLGGADLIAADPAAPPLASTGVPFLGASGACPEVGASPQASPLPTAVVRHGRGLRAWFTLRVAAPGAPPVTLAGSPRAPVRTAAVASNASGAAVVVWEEDSTPRVFSDASDRLLLARRPAAGQPFSPPRVLDRGLADLPAPPAIGIDARGNATVAWLRGGGPDGSVIVVRSRPDGSLGPDQQLGSDVHDEPSLAVAPGGDALVAFVDGISVDAFERPASASRFARLAVPSGDGDLDQTAVALADDGGAVVATRWNATLSASVRPPGGAFGPMRRLAGPPQAAFDESIEFFVSGATGPHPPPDDTGRALHAAIGSDGSILLTAVEPSTAGAAAVAVVARGSLTGGFTKPRRVGSPCRPVAGATPFALAAGGLGLAWIDDAHALSNDLFDSALGGGTLHVTAGALPAARRAAAPLDPGLRARVAGPRTLRGGQPLLVRVRCTRGPCDVRASALEEVRSELAHRADATPIEVSRTLPRDRVATIALRPDRKLTVALPLQRVGVIACTPDGPRAASLTLRPRLRAAT